MTVTRGVGYVKAVVPLRKTYISKMKEGVIIMCTVSNKCSSNKFCMNDNEFKISQKALILIVKESRMSIKKYLQLFPC